MDSLQCGPSLPLYRNHWQQTAPPPLAPSISLEDTFQFRPPLEKPPDLKDLLPQLPLRGEQFSSGDPQRSYLNISGDTFGPGNRATGEKVLGGQVSESLDANLDIGPNRFLPRHLHVSGKDTYGLSVQEQANATSYKRTVGLGVDAELKGETSVLHPKADSKPGFQADAFVFGAEAGAAARLDSTLESSPTRVGASVGARLKAGAAINRGVDVKASSNAGSSFNLSARGGVGPSVGGSGGIGFSRDTQKGETQLNVQVDLAAVFEADLQAGVTIKDEDVRAYDRAVWGVAGAAVGLLAGPQGMKAGHKVGQDLGEKVAQTELNLLNGGVTLVNQGYQKLHKAQADLTAMARRTIDGLIG